MAIYEEVIKCKECGEVKPHTHYKKQNRKLKDGSTSVHLDSRTCKSCGDKHTSVRNKLKRIYPYPEDNTCQCCGKDFRTHPKRPRPYLSLDHDHVTMEFRGYICESCNTGVGKLGDTKEGLQVAMNYLETTQQRRDEYHQKYNINENKVESKINYVKPKQVIKDMDVKYHNLVRYCIDQQDLDYATKVVDLIGNEYSVKVTESTSQSSNSKETTIEKRRKRKQRFINSWKPVDSTKNLNLIEGSVVFGLKQPMTIVNRKEETFDEYINSGIFYKNPNGTQNFLVDVDKLHLIKVKV